MACRGLLETLVEFYFVDGVSLLIGKVVELGFELVGVDFGDLGEGCNRGREEDEETCTDQCEVYGSCEWA